VRALTDRDLAGTLRQVSETGYRNVETPREFFDKQTAGEVRALLDRYSLRAPAGFFPYVVFQDNFARVVDTAHAVGQQYIGVPGLPENLRSSRADVRKIADRFNELGTRLQREGLKFYYHNHAWEFNTLGGNAPVYDMLLEQTDPDLVGFELDLYWVNKAGYDPVAYIDRFPGRFPLFHLKDSTAAPAKDFAPVGEGVLDFRLILSRAGTAGLKYAFVEHDRPADPLASMRTSYTNLVAMLPQS
jgi:sugar phosphate isomerase/epimerase